MLRNRGISRGEGVAVADGLGDPEPLAGGLLGGVPGVLAASGGSWDPLPGVPVAGAGGGERGSLALESTTWGVPKRTEFCNSSLLKRRDWELIGPVALGGGLVVTAGGKAPAPGVDGLNGYPPGGNGVLGPGAGAGLEMMGPCG